MTAQSTAGATLGVTSAAPGSYDAYGYYQLGYTLIGEVTNIGEFGRDGAKIEHKPLATGGTVKSKGGFDFGGLSVQMACDEKDAGQQLLEAALASPDHYHFRILRNDGTAHFVSARVFSFKRSLGERDGIVNVMTSLEIGATGVVTLLAGVVPVPPPQGLTADGSNPANAPAFVH